MVYRSSARMPTKKITPAALKLIACKLKTLAVESRLAILNELRDGEKTVSHLTSATGLSQANVSKHLAVLKRAGLVDFRKEGQHSFYAISDPVVFKLCDLLCKTFQAEMEREAAISPRSRSGMTGR